SCGRTTSATAKPSQATSASNWTKRAARHDYHGGSAPRRKTRRKNSDRPVALRHSLRRRSTRKTMKQTDLPLVRPIGAKLSPEALSFIARVAKLFPGSERDIIIVRATEKKNEKD